MNEMMKLIGDYGLLILMLAGISLIFVKYIPKLMNIWIARLEAKNSANDLMYEQFRNNTQVIENNSKALENSSRALENNTEAYRQISKHYDTINESMKNFNQTLCVHDKRAEEIAKDTAILLERNKK